MSVENLKEYALRCATDPELRARARAIGVEDMEQHMRHAASLGMDWTLNDMAAFRKEVVDAENDLQDLTEEELEQIAGGAFSVTLVGSLVVGALVGGAVAGGAAIVGTTAGGGGASAAGKGGW